MAGNLAYVMNYFYKVNAIEIYVAYSRRSEILNIDVRVFRCQLSHISLVHDDRHSPIPQSLDVKLFRDVILAQGILQCQVELVFLELKESHQSTYSVQQKQCTTTLVEKSMVFAEVNLFEILHASTYTIYEYIYEVRKPAADGNPEL